MMGSYTKFSGFMMVVMFLLLSIFKIMTQFSIAEQSGFYIFLKAFAITFVVFFALSISIFFGSFVRNFYLLIVVFFLTIILGIIFVNPFVIKTF